MTNPWAGLRLLVVEDEFINAMFTVDSLEERGCVVVGPAASLDEAMELAERESMDGAILDVNLAGQPVFPLTDRLVARGVPVLLTTGYDSSTLPERMRGLCQLQKPFSDEQLFAALGRLFPSEPARRASVGA